MRLEKTQSTDAASYQNLLSFLASANYSSKDEGMATFYHLAVAVWHNGFVPDLNLYSGEALRRAAYAVDTLKCFYEGFDDEQLSRLKVQLNAAMKHLSSTDDQAPVTFYPNDTVVKLNFDDLTTDWGLSRGAQVRKVPGFLNAQRRSYHNVA